MPVLHRLPIFAGFWFVLILTNFCYYSYCLDIALSQHLLLRITKLSDKFNIKDQVKKEHQHNLVYIVNCPSQACTQTYIGETARRLTSGLEEHSGKSEQSNVTRHSIDSGHSLVQLSNFKILTQIQSKGTNTRKNS